MGVVPKLASLREQVATHLPTFDLSNFDNIGRFAVALIYANARYHSVTSPPAALPELHEKVITLRNLFYADATALNKHGILPGDCVPKMRFGNGYKNAAGDLAILVTVFKDNWPKIAGKIPIDEVTLAEAEIAARQLLEAAGAKAQPPEVIAEATEIRAKIYTCLVNCYDQWRRALGYLRWEHDDLDAFAPSLYTGRGGSARKQTEPEPANPATPEAVESAAATPAVPAHPTNGSSKAKIAVGLPGSDPFIG